MSWVTIVLLTVLLAVTAASAAPPLPPALQLQAVPRPALPRAVLESPQPSTSVIAGLSHAERILRGGLYGGLTGALFGSGLSLLTTGHLDRRTVQLSAGIGAAGGATLGLLESLRLQAESPAQSARPLVPPNAPSVNSGLPGARILLRKKVRF